MLKRSGIIRIWVKAQSQVYFAGCWLGSWLLAEDAAALLELKIEEMTLDSCLGEPIAVLHIRLALLCST